MKSTALIDASHSARVGSLRYQLGSMGDNGYSFIFLKGPERILVAREFLGKVCGYTQYNRL